MSGRSRWKVRIVNRLVLYCVQGVLRGRSFPLAPGEELLLGRRMDPPGVSLEDALSSRRHARLVAAQDHILVEDLGSSNGTRINGRRIKTTTRLEPGDVLSLGQTSLVLDAGDNGSSSSGFHLDDADRQAGPPPVTALIPHDDAQQQIGTQRTISEGAARILLSALAAAPFGILVIDRDRVVLANDVLKGLGGLSIGADRPAAEVLDALSRLLVRPPELKALIAATDCKPQHLALASGGSWRAWARQVPEGTAVYLLVEA